MEYIFGEDYRQDGTETGALTENLKTIGEEHTDFSGFVQTYREYDDCTITDNFRVLEHYHSDEDIAGNKYDWYFIDCHSRDTDRFSPIRAQIEQSNAVAQIAFVKLVQTGEIDATTAGEHQDMFAEWQENVGYNVGDVVRYNDKLYQCVQAHKSQADWTPEAYQAGWKNFSDPSDPWPEWSQPIGAHDAYDQGARVSHNGKKWTSDIPANVWEPGVYGWTEYQEPEA